MRVVIDGLPIGNDDNLGRIVSRLLQVWGQPRGADELHLVVGASPQIVIPDWVVVHQVRSEQRGPLGRLYARTVGLPRLCRSLKAQVLLGLRPTKGLTSISCPRRTVMYDLWGQPGSEQFTGTALVEPETGIAWSGFARRLRLSMVDAVADRDWHTRCFQMRPRLLWSRPAPVKARPEWALPRLSLPPRRSFRWIAGVSASTLVLSAAAAASVDLVASHNFPVDSPHHIVSPSGGTPNTVGGGTSAPSGNVPMPAATTSSTTSSTAPTSPTTSSSSLLPATPTTTVAAPKSGPELSIPGLTLPDVTLPSIPTPSLPLPTVTCSTNPTATTTPLSFLTLCNLNVGSLTLGSK